MASCPNPTINASFHVLSGLRMDPASIQSALFTVTGPGLAQVLATSVVLDAATGRIATFTPGTLTAGVTYIAQIKGGASGVRGLAIPANTMTADMTWTFTAGACPATPAFAAIQLGVAASTTSWVVLQA